MEQRKKLEERIVFADLHLGEGQYVVGKKNLLEYFDSDEEFKNLIDLLLKIYSDFEGILELDLLGDTFDFLTVSYKDRIEAEPTEDAALEKITKILNAHPIVVNAFRCVLRFGGRIKFFFGNHDLPLVWANVQNYIRNVLTEGLDNKEKINQWKRIQFVFEEEKNGVFFTHGNGSEPICAMPKRTFLESRFGKKLIPPLLNHPYGNHLATDLANRLASDTFFCKGNYWIGRLEPHWYVYLESLWKNWHFVAYTAPLWLTTPIRHRFSRRWWVRKNADIFTLGRHNFDAMITTMLNKMRGRDFTHYAKKILRKNKHIDIVFAAHTHEFRKVTLQKSGTYIFPGAWCMGYRAQFPEIELEWKRLQTLELGLKNVLAVAKLFDKETSKKYLPKKHEVYSFATCSFYEDGYKEASLMRFNPERNCIEELN